jgi:CBS domain containing-hemolysin-like protein
MVNISLIIRFVILTVLLIISAFFSACEVAFFSLTKVRIDTMKEKGKRGADIVANLLEKPRQLLITIYLGNDLINVAISAIVASVSIHIFGERGISIAIGSGTFLLLIFGDITPKTFAIKNNERVALFSAYPLKIFSILISPIQRVFTAIANRSIILFGGKGLDEEYKITEDEIRTMINVGEDEGAIELEEKKMIESVFDLGDTKVMDIMTTREDIFSIEVSSDLRNVISRIKSSSYSRIPVYEGNIDNIVGVLYSKDLMKYTYSGQEILPRLKEILHPPFIVTAKKKVNELLKDFRKQKVHMALVCDEYVNSTGSPCRVAGLVTMDDILTELVVGI